MNTTTPTTGSVLEMRAVVDTQVRTLLVLVSGFTTDERAECRRAFATKDPVGSEQMRERFMTGAGFEFRYETSGEPTSPTFLPDEAAAMWDVIVAGASRLSGSPALLELADSLAAKFPAMYAAALFAVAVASA